MAKQNTIKFINKKVRDTGDISDYEKTPLGADSDNVDRPDGSTAEENFVNIDNGVDIGRTLKYEDPYLYLLDGEGKELSRVLLVLPSHVHNYSTEEITKEATYTEAGLKKCTCACGDYHTEEIPMLVDSTNPTGTITVGENTYTSLVENPSFDTYFKTAQNVTISGVDNESGVKSISYYVSDTKIAETGLADVAWVAYDSGFTIEPNRNAIVYAKITDNQDNVTYICSDGIVLDNIAPVFNGMEDGGTYGVGTTLTLQDGETLFVNGEEVELTDNTYTFNVEDNYLLSIKDRAGNESSTISVNIVHVHNFVDEICTICGKNEYEDFELTKSNMSMAGVTRSGDVVIPEKFEYDGKKYRITSIGLNAFYESTNLTSVTIPDSVISIKETAFAVCDSLSSVTLSNNLSSIGRSAFGSCTSLQTITIPEGVAELNGVFSGCSGLEAINLPSTITTIGDYTFNNCQKLSNLDLSSTSVTSIGKYAFKNCTSLKAANIPYTVTNMGDYTFEGCSALQTLTIPGNPNKNSDVYKMLNGCTLLTTVNIADGSTEISNYLLNSITVFESYSDSVIDTINIPESVSIIGKNAFSSNTHLVDLKIPNSVMIIGSGAFSGTGLVNINIPRNECMIIGSSVFANCKNLEEVTIPGDYSIDTTGKYDLNGGNYLFDYCTALKTVNIAEGSTNVKMNICNSTLLYNFLYKYKKTYKVLRIV